MNKPMLQTCARSSFYKDNSPESQESYESLEVLEAKDILQAHNIDYTIEDPVAGIFNCVRKSDNKVFRYHADTEEIEGEDPERGVHSLIRLLTCEEEPRE